jgi:hypothetical protein
MGTLVEEQAALENADDVCAIANALLAAKHHDALRTAAGLLVIAQLLVDGDLFGRIALAELMREMADALDATIH